MTALSVTSHGLLMTNIPADQPLGGGWTGVVFWSKLNTRRIVSSALNMGYMLPKFHGHISLTNLSLKLQFCMKKAAMKLSSLPLKMSVSYRNRTYNRVLGGPRYIHLTKETNAVFSGFSALLAPAAISMNSITLVMNFHCILF